MFSRRIAKYNRWNSYTLLAIVATVLLICGCGNSQRAANVGTQSARADDQSALNINTATAAELEKIPHIGEVLARKIVDFRADHGPFRRPEHLMLIDGISDAKFRSFRHMIRTE